MFGGLNVTSDPTNSLIFINDSATGFSTPHIFNHLIPGPYNLKCEKTGFRDNVVEGLVFSNETRAFFVELEDTTLWVDYQKSNSNIQSVSLSSIDIDNNNIIWIGSVDSGLIKFDGRNFTNFSTSNSSIPSDNIICVKHDNQNKLWVGTDNGLGIFYNNNWSILNKDNSPLPTNRIETIAFENNISWIGTSGGLAKYDGTNWQIYTINNTNLPWHWIKTISIDQLNNKWLGISDSGIASYNDQVFTIYRAGESNIPTDNPSASAVSANGNIWFGFLPSINANGGIAIFNGNDWNQVNIGNPQLQVNDIYIDQYDIKWISTNQGLFKMTGQSVEQQFTIYNSKLTSPSVTSSIRDNSGNLWITTLSGGLNKYKGAIKLMYSNNFSNFLLSLSLEDSACLKIDASFVKSKTLTSEISGLI